MAAGELNYHTFEVLDALLLVRILSQPCMAHFEGHWSCHGTLTKYMTASVHG